MAEHLFVRGGFEQLRVHGGLVMRAGLRGRDGKVSYFERAQTLRPVRRAKGPNAAGAVPDSGPLID